MQTRKLFLSYCSNDSQIALSLRTEFLQHGIEAWAYEVDSGPGLSYLEQTGQAIVDADAFAIIVSRQSFASNQMTIELVRAHEEKKLLIPILVDVEFREIQELAPQWRQAISAAVAIDSRRHSASTVCQLIARSVQINCANISPNRNLNPLEPPPSPLFSESIRTTFLEVGKKIDVLTKEQIAAFRTLNSARRLKVKGCAGSGKTMLLAEKAIRLSNAGLRVLVLCHNPNLAAFIARLTEGASVDVSSFSSWIKRILVTPHDLSCHPTEESAEWQIYDEPDEATLDAVLSALSRNSIRYDAILVDEAQDFRDTWWIAVEGALAHSELSFFYVFFDDHQNLVPARFGAFPFKGTEAHLSKNVRNAGKVFNVVKYYHPAAPKAAALVESDGYVAHVRGYRPELGLRKALAILDAFGADCVFR